MQNIFRFSICQTPSPHTENKYLLENNENHYKLSQSQDDSMMSYVDLLKSLAIPLNGIFKFGISPKWNNLFFFKSYLGKLLMTVILFINIYINTGNNQLKTETNTVDWTLSIATWTSSTVSSLYPFMLLSRPALKPS